MKTSNRKKKRRGDPDSNAWGDPHWREGEGEKEGAGHTKKKKGKPGGFVSARSEDGSGSRKL